MSKTFKQFIAENVCEPVLEERMPERDVVAHKIDPKTWQRTLPADEVESHGGGEFTFYRALNYRYSGTSKKLADRISTQLRNLNIKHIVVGHREGYGSPNMGGPVTKHHHFSVRVKIHAGQAARIGEDGEIQRRIEGQ